MASALHHTYPDRLTRAGEYLAQVLEALNKPVVTQFEFFRLTWQMYNESQSERLYLRSQTPSLTDYTRIRQNLKSAGFIRSDRDYGTRVIRVLAISDLPAEDVVCLIDPTCYVSHLSAMQRWGLTNRNPKELSLTRPDKITDLALRAASATEANDIDRANPFPIRIAAHPKVVRKRPLQINETKTVGEFIQERESAVRISTIGQTFLDMLQKPSLCGGMDHVIEIWQEHAENYLEEIVTSVDTATSNLVKSRAGYLLEEKLRLKHERLGTWKALGQRGSSRRLDPSKPFASAFSETWMISLNV